MLLFLNNNLFSQNHSNLCLTILYFAIVVSVGVAVVSAGVAVVSVCRYIFVWLGTTVVSVCVVSAGIAFDVMYDSLAKILFTETKVRIFYK